MQAQDILDFWYADDVQSKWFNSTPEFDQELLSRFETVWNQARNGQLNEWLQSATGCLALAIILDQFPLNMFRGQAKSFSTESNAINVARHAVESGLDKELEPAMRVFLYMPLMHSEDLVNQDLSVKLFEAAGLKENLRFAEHHRDIVRQYGRFPHRNEILGRESSQQEKEYLESDEAFKG